MMRPELLCERPLFGAPRDGRDTKTHACRELDAQMSQSTEPLHGHEVAGTSRRMAQRVVSGQPRAEQWSRIGRTEFIRNGDQSARNRDHRFGVTTIEMNAADRLVGTIHEISPATGSADAAMAAEEAHADTLADFPTRDAFAQCVDFPNDFMTGHARKAHAGHQA